MMLFTTPLGGDLSLDPARIVGVREVHGIRRSFGVRSRITTADGRSHNVADEYDWIMERIGAEAVKRALRP